MFALLELVMPVNQALGEKVMISSVPGKRGIDAAVVLTTTAFSVALVEVAPTPKKATTVPELMIRYWLPPSVLETHCTGVGAVVAAAKVIVLPDGQKGADTLIRWFLP